MKVTKFDPATGRVLRMATYGRGMARALRDDEVEGHPPADGRLYRVDVQTREFVPGDPPQFPEE